MMKKQVHIPVGQHLRFSLFFPHLQACSNSEILASQNQNEC